MVSPSTYRCACGHVLRTFGRGRHHTYFELGGGLVDPVMDRVCPSCGRRLPGKNPAGLRAASVHR
jgi:hypothetical protein